MDNKRYYDFLNHGIKWKDKPNINGHGFITCNGIPFYNAGDAVKYIMNYYPTAEPKDKLIKEDPQACRKAASRMETEIEHLIEMISEMIETKHAEINKTAEEINRLSDRDLMESVHKTVLTDDLYRKQGEHSGLIAANAVLRDRFSEFLNCRSLKG